MQLQEREIQLAHVNQQLETQFERRIVEFEQQHNQRETEQLKAKASSRGEELIICNVNSDGEREKGYHVRCTDILMLLWITTEYMLEMENQ